MFQDAYQYDCIVNTVNTTGVMGAGIAKKCIEKYPIPCEMFNYLCRRDRLDGGTIRIYPNYNLEKGQNPKYICMFATKQEVNNPAEYVYVEQGLKTLVERIQSLRIGSIAIPPLGCGYGGLDWAEVKPMILEAIEPIKDTCEIYIYEQ